MIDPNLCKQKSNSPQMGMDSLIIMPALQVTILPHAGPTGNTFLGKCFCLYTTSFQQEMDEDMIPEIQRTNLSTMVLLLKRLGIHDL